jgi:ribosomal protein S12 methylthiotransferase accessory factor
VPAADTVPLPEKPDGALAALCSILSARNMPVFAVDRTPRELASVGLTAVSVVIPGLQPMSLHPYGKFADSDRLRRAPKDMGLMPLPEESLNPWPQPFT